MTDTSSFTHTIDGRAATSSQFFGVIDPATGEPFASCPEASPEQLDEAVAAAQRAFPEWRGTSIEARRALIHAFAQRLTDAADTIAPVLTAEQGRPLADAKFELTVAAHHIKQLSSLPLEPVEILRDDGAHRVELHHRPLGVVAGIAPWNFPIALSMHKVAQALYTGNTLVLKPSPYTPLATLLVGALGRGLFPSGVLNVIAGGNALGSQMTTHDGIDKVSFTGSVPTGKNILAASARTLKRVTLELGGNDPAIVLDDADPEAVIAGVFRSAFFNAGQICMAVKRVYVADALFEAIAEGLAERARQYRVGAGHEAGVQMGPIQNRMQFDKVMDLLDDAKRQPNATLRAGGHRLNRPGYFIAPTVITGLDDDARLVQEEQFGPVLPIQRFREIDDAVRRANGTRYGLGASVWSRDIEKATTVATGIEAGTVWVNRHGVNESDVPFGGVKESGFGREHGVTGLRAYMEPHIISRPATAKA